MSTNNKIETKNGVASDDKSKDGKFSDPQCPSGGNDSIVAKPDRVTTPASATADRGGSAIDDRSKGFEAYDHPKA